MEHIGTSTGNHALFTSVSTVFFPLNLEDLMPKVKGPRQSRDALYEETHPVVCIVIEILHYVHSQIFNQMDVQAPQSMDRSPYQ
jgi:hypothetical protein